MSTDDKTKGSSDDPKKSEAEKIIRQANALRELVQKLLKITRKTRLN
ncbi:MAG: hypothetical protein NTW14_04005 [bacterium]|nr:hypothetical protein [bacterium]